MNSGYQPAPKCTAGRNRHKWREGRCVFCGASPAKYVSIQKPAPSKVPQANPETRLAQFRKADDPMAAGFEAALASFRANPFPLTGDKYPQWRDGWKAAAEDIFKGKELP